jgi:hypothetical protein
MSLIPTREELADYACLWRRFYGVCKAISEESPNASWAAYSALVEEIVSTFKSSTFLAPYGWPDVLTGILRELRRSIPVNFSRSENGVLARERLDSLIKTLESIVSNACSGSIETIPGPNAERDKYCYDEKVKGTKLESIKGALNATPGWGHLGTVQGVTDAADAHAEKHGLQPPRKYKRK